MKRPDSLTKVLLAIIAAGLCVLILRPYLAPVAKVVRAAQFQVVDSQGEVRAALGLLPDGTPSLALREKDGTLRAALVLPGRLDGAPGLVLFDKEGKTRAGVMVLKDGSPGLFLDDKDEKVRAALGVFPDGSPGLDLRDKDGKVLWSAP